jgi:hypothetical protein
MFRSRYHTLDEALAGAEIGQLERGNGTALVSGGQGRRGRGHVVSATGPALQDSRSSATRALGSATWA